MPCLYLIPSALSTVKASYYVPEHNVQVIRELRHFVVENVRTARRFIKFVAHEVNINELQFTVFDEHTSPNEIPAMLSPIDEGCSIGIISEAGCPAVADPGAELVALAQQKGIKVVPLVGPSSIIMALMASGFNGQGFAFCGYLPTDHAARTTRLQQMQRLVQRQNQTQIFIETPYRNNQLLSDLCATLSPDIKLCVACNITADDEQIITRDVGWWRQNTPEFPKAPAIFLIGS